MTRSSHLQVIEGGRRRRSALAPVLRLYLRRSKADQGHQQFSLDVQRDGCRRFAEDELPRRGMTTSWEQRIEYVDDDRAGDDFVGRAAFARLREELQPGDAIVCRDQSRLGRDALEVTLAIRDLVRDRGARLFYYINGQEVTFANAIDQATTFLTGTAHQMELEAIRSRTREALRQRVREGRVAGGRCYGYELKRQSDPMGRQYTIAEVHTEQAEIVRRIFREFADGRGYLKIAVGLNNDGVASPDAGKRGTGSWAPSCVRSMILNPRYRGIYVHGRVNRVRRGGRRIPIPAKPSDIITVEIPEWRIIDDDLWMRVEAILERNKRKTPPNGGRLSPGNACKYTLSGIARCRVCTGAIGVARTVRVKHGPPEPAYVCTWHRLRGPAVCSMTITRPVRSVDAKFVDHIRKSVLDGDGLDQLVEQIRREASAQTATPSVDVEVISRELAELRREQSNLARAVAASGEDFPELLEQMRERRERIRRLEQALSATQRPAERVPIDKVVDMATARARNLRAALANPGDAREVFLATFPDGMTFEPAPGGRSAFLVRGGAHLHLPCVNQIVTPA